MSRAGERIIMLYTLVFAAAVPAAMQNFRFATNELLYVAATSEQTAPCFAVPRPSLPPSLHGLVCRTARATRR